MICENKKNKAFNKLKVRIKLVEKFNELEESLNSNTNNKNNDNEILLKEKKKINN